MLKKFLLLSFLLVFSFTAIACSTTNKKQEQKEVSQETFTNIKDNVVSIQKGEVVPYDSSLAQTNVVDWYVDPISRACIKLQTISKDDILEMSSKKTIRYHLSSFLNTDTVDDYSVRASAYLLGVAEVSPSIYMEYMNAIFSTDFRPDTENGAQTEDSRFKDKFTSLGGTEEQWDKIEGMKETLKTTVKRSTVADKSNKELLAKSPSGTISLPFIVVGESKQCVQFSETVAGNVQVKNDIAK